MRGSFDYHPRDDTYAASSSISSGVGNGSGIAAGESARVGEGESAEAGPRSPTTLVS